MTDFADRLARLTVRVTSPDGRICAELRGRTASVSLSSPDVLDDYRSAEILASQVATALNSASAAAERAQRILVEQHTALRVEDEPNWNPSRRRFRAERDRLEAEGRSPRGLVRVTTIALLQWRVILAAGALRRLDGPTFCGEVNGALADARRAHAEATYELKTAHFGEVGLPRR